MMLEDDAGFNLEIVCRNPARPNLLEKLKSTTFFFRPVEGNLVHHSILGEQPIRFDFMVQSMLVVDADFGESGSPSSITTVNKSIPPSTMTLSTLPFDVLSKTYSCGMIQKQATELMLLCHLTDGWYSFPLNLN